MGHFIATSLIKLMIQEGISIQQSRITILGVTFKENVPDVRNSKIFDIIKQLQELKIEVQCTDPLADQKEVKEEYQLTLRSLDEIQPADVVILAVPHQQYIGTDGIKFPLY